MDGGNRIKKIIVLGGTNLDWGMWREQLNRERVEFIHETKLHAILYGGEDCLYMTDSGDTANALTAEGYAVLGLLHSGNQSENFWSLPYIMEYTPEADLEYLERAYRRLKGIPWLILETERTWIRETVPEDVDAFWAIYSESAITRYTEGLYPSPEEERRYIEKYIESMYRFYGFGVWTILLKETGRIIGRAGFSLREGYEEPELGFVIGLPWQNQGLCKETCRSIVDYGWNELGFAGIQALVRPENHASEAVCRSLGMQWAGNVVENHTDYMRWLIHAPQAGLK